MEFDTETLEGTMVDADPSPAIHSARNIEDGFDDLDSPSIVIGIDLLPCDEPALLI